MKLYKLWALGLALMVMFAGCGAEESSSSPSTSSGASASTVSQSEEYNTEMFTDRDFEIGYDEEQSALIQLDGDSAQCDSDAVSISGSTVTITDEGTYILSGTLRQLMDTSIYDMCRLPELPAPAEADMESITIRGAAPEEGEAPTVVLTAQVSGESVSWRSDGSNVTADGTVRALLEDLTALSFARCVDYKPSEEAVAICGLDAPEATVEIAYTAETGEAATLTLSVGGRLPDKSGRYTRVDGDSTIYLMETALLDPLMRVAANGLDG